jgi:hypothetical protein
MLRKSKQISFVDSREVTTRGTITVYATLYGSKCTHVGSSPPESPTKIVLGELARETSKDEQGQG